MDSYVLSQHSSTLLVTGFLSSLFCRLFVVETSFCLVLCFRCMYIDSLNLHLLISFGITINYTDDEPCTPPSLCCYHSSPSLAYTWCGFLFFGSWCKKEFNLRWSAKEFLFSSSTSRRFLLKEKRMRQLHGSCYLVHCSGRWSRIYSRKDNEQARGRDRMRAREQKRRARTWEAEKQKTFTYIYKFWCKDKLAVGRILRLNGWQVKPVGV